MLQRADSVGGGGGTSIPYILWSKDYNIGVNGNYTALSYWYYTVPASYSDDYIQWSGTTITVKKNCKHYIAGSGSDGHWDDLVPNDTFSWAGYGDIQFLIFE